MTTNIGFPPGYEEEHINIGFPPGYEEAKSQSTTQPVVQQPPIQNTPAQPQVVQDIPVQSQAVKNNVGNYTLSTGIQKKTMLGTMNNLAKKLFTPLPVKLWDNRKVIGDSLNNLYQKKIKPTYENVTHGLWHLGGKGLRAVLPKKAALPFLSEDWWFGTDEQHERLNQLDDIAEQSGYYDQNAIRNDFLKGKLSRKQANAYAQLVGERERLLDSLNYINTRAGNTAEGITDVLAAAVPGGEFKGAASAVGKGIYNATRAANASKGLALGTGKVGRYLTKHTLRGGQIGAEMAVLKNLYENGAGIEHDPFVKELAENIGIGIVADNVLPIGFKGAGWVGGKIGKGINKGAEVWENTANKLADSNQNAVAWMGNRMNDLGNVATEAGALAKRFFTSDLNKINIFGDRVNDRARFNEKLAQLTNEDSFKNSLDPQIIKELEALPEEYTDEIYEALYNGKDLYGNPLEPSDAYKLIMEKINADRVAKGLEPHKYSNGWEEPNVAQENVINESVIKQPNNVADTSVEDAIRLWREQGYEDDQIANLLEYHGLSSKEPIVEQGYEALPQAENPNVNFTTNNSEKLAGTVNVPPKQSVEIPGATILKDDTEALVGKLNELNGNRPNTGNSRYDEWISKNKQKHAEGSGSHVKDETGINTREPIETAQNEPANHVKTDNTNRQLPKKIIENEYKFEQPIENMKVTKLESGDAEGSHTSMRDLSMERPDTVKSKESTTEVIDDIYDKDSHINVETPFTNRYVSDDAEFNKWFNKYEKADKETRIQMQKDKMTDFNSQEESIDFYNKFTEQVDRDKRIAERNQTSPSVTEDDVISFSSNYEAADILPSANRNIVTVLGKKVKNNSNGEVNYSDFKSKVSSVLRRCKNSNEVTQTYERIKSRLPENEHLSNLLDACRDVNFYGKKAAGLRKTLDRTPKKYKDVYSNLKKQYDEFKQLEENAISKVKELSKNVKEYKGNFKKASNKQVVIKNGKVETIQDKSPEPYNKPYAYKDKTVLGIDTDKAFLERLDTPRQQQLDDVLNGKLSDNNTKLQSRWIDGELVTAKPSEKYKKIDFSKTHKAKDYAEDLSSGNKYVKAFLKNNDIEFAFEDMGEHGWTDAKTYKHFKLNIKESIEDTLIAGKHEVGHIIQKAIAEFSPEMAQIIKETEIANSKFFKACKDVPEDKIKEFIDWDNLTEKELSKKLEKLSETEQNKFWEITDKYFDYKYSEGEQLAQQASKGDYSGYGEENLRELYNRTIRTNKQRNNANKRRRKTNGKEEGDKGNEQGLGDSFGSVFDFTNEGRRVNKSSSKQQVGLNFLKKQHKTYEKAAESFDFKRASHDEKYANNFIKDLKNSVNNTENIVKKRLLATDPEILGRLELTGAETYLAPTKYKLNVDKTKLSKSTIKEGIKTFFDDWFRGVSDVAPSYNVKEVFGHKSSSLERKRSLQQQYVNTKMREAKIQSINNVMNEVESMPQTKPIIDGKIDKGYVPIKQGIMSNVLATTRGKDFYHLLERGDADEIMRAFVKSEHLASDGSNISGELRNKFPNLFDSKGKFVINSKLNPEIMLDKKNPKAIQAYRAARHFIDIAEREKEPSYQVPKYVFDILCSMNNEKVADAFMHYGLTSGTLGQLGATIADFPVTLAKRAFLGLSTGWNIGNRLNNPILLGMQEKDARSLAKHYLQAFSLKNEDLPPELFDNNLLETNKLRETMANVTGDEKYDTVIGLLAGNTVPKQTAEHFIRKIGRGATIGVRIPTKIGEANMKFNEMFENFERKVAYAKQLDDLVNKRLVRNVSNNIIRQGMALPELNKIVMKDAKLRKYVLDRVYDTLGDFQALTPIEKGMCKRVAIFYSWLRTINRSLYKVASENPTKALMAYKTIQDIKEDDVNHKDFQKGALPIDSLPFVGKLNLTRDGKRILFNPMRYFNYYDTHEEAATRPGSTLNPYITLTREAVTGKSSFDGKNYKSKKYAQSGYKDYAQDKYIEGLWNTETQDWVRDKDGKISNSMPLDSRLRRLGVGSARLLFPSANASLINYEKALDAYNTMKSDDTWKAEQGNRIEPDRLYDDAFGGYNNGDIYRIKVKKNGGVKVYDRYAATRFNKAGQTIKHLLGGVFQEEMSLNNDEKAKRTAKLIDRKLEQENYDKYKRNKYKKEKEKKLSAWKAKYKK